MPDLILTAHMQAQIVIGAAVVAAGLICGVLILVILKIGERLR